MKINEQLKISFKLFSRSKNKLYSTIILICSIITIISMLFSTNVLTLVSKAKDSDWFKIITVSSSETIRTKEEMEKIKSINHVIDIYDEDRINTLVDIKLNDNNDESLLLRRKNTKYLPHIVYGRAFKEDETNVMICPEKLYFINDNNENKIINTKDYLNKEIQIEYYDYKPGEKFIATYDDNDKPVYSMYKREENEKHTENYTIVGLFNNGEYYTDPSTCFVPMKEGLRLNTIQYDYYDKENNKLKEENNLGSDGFFVLVDKSKNNQYVIDELKKLGYESEMGTEFDKNIYSTVYTIIIISLTISFVTLIIVNTQYMKKELLKEKKNIFISYATGYDKKSIASIYFLKMCIENTITFLISLIITLIIYHYAYLNIDILKIVKLAIGYNMDIPSYILSYLIIVIAPSLVIYNKVKKMLLKD